MPDFALARAAARAEIREGLLRTPPSISPKFFYDPVGSDLFDRITRTPEYYLTATEITILETNLDEIAAGIGPRAVLAEIAAGSARKARIVLGGLESPAAYAPVDIAEETLTGQATAVRRDFPDLNVIPVAADFSRDFALPAFHFDHGRIALFYAGLLARELRACGSVGFPRAARARRRPRLPPPARRGPEEGPGGPQPRLQRPRRPQRRLQPQHPEQREPARGRRLRPGKVAPAPVLRRRTWPHRAVARKRRGPDGPGRRETLRFAAGDRIHTESSYKYDVEEVLALAAPGWRPLHHWSDRAERFSVFLLAA